MFTNIIKFIEFFSQFLIFSVNLSIIFNYYSYFSLVWKKWHFPPILEALIGNTNQLQWVKHCKTLSDWLSSFSRANQRAPFIDRYHPNAGAHSADIHGVVASFVQNQSAIERALY